MADEENDKSEAPESENSNPDDGIATISTSYTLPDWYNDESYYYTLTHEWTIEVEGYYKSATVTSRQDNFKDTPYMDGGPSCTLTWDYEIRRKTEEVFLVYMSVTAVFDQAPTTSSSSLGKKTSYCYFSYQIQYTNNDGVLATHGYDGALFGITVTKYYWATRGIKYDANGGSGAPSADITSKYITSVSNVSFKISSTTPTRSGYTFLGWSTSSSATSASYQPGGSISVGYDSTVTLYAVWGQEYTCYLKYDANGGSGAPSTQSYTDTSTDNHTFTISSTIPTREGYVFEGWSTSSSGLAVYQPGGSISVGYDSTVTLYAVWGLAGNFIVTEDGTDTQYSTINDAINAINSADKGSVLSLKIPIGIWYPTVIMKIPSTASLTIESDGTLDYRDATLESHVGAILVQSGSSSQSTTLIVNSGTYTGAVCTGSYGALIELDGSYTYAEINGGTFSGNTGQCGPVFYLTGSSTGVINGGTFSGNSATVSGGISMVGSTGSLTVNGGVFVGNVGVNGGVFRENTSSGTIIINGGTFSGNSATYGGVLSHNGTGPITINDGIFSGNSATRGGCVDSSSTGTIATKGGIYVANSATSGDVFSNASTGTFEITDATVYGASGTALNGTITLDNIQYIESWTGISDIDIDHKKTFGKYLRDFLFTTEPEDVVGRRCTIGIFDNVGYGTWEQAKTDTGGRLSVSTIANGDVVIRAYPDYPTSAMQFHEFIISLADGVAPNPVDFIETTHASQFRYDEAQKLEDLTLAIANAIGMEIDTEEHWGVGRTVSYVDFERWESNLFKIYKVLGGETERTSAIDKDSDSN